MLFIMNIQLVSSNIHLERMNVKNAPFCFFLRDREKKGVDLVA
jgi:hypothetical protein